jgi:DNA invertase Pin-like site-specific DNA recombinase
MNYVAYFRVSTQKQETSGLGLEAQQASVRSYLQGIHGQPIAEVTEVESGKKADRPKLTEALRLCRVHKATLVIAKLDRLARNVVFITQLLDAGVDFVALDLPSANRMTIQIMAVVAEAEAKAISERTKAALAAAKARGVKLGGFRGHVGSFSSADGIKGVLKRQEAAESYKSDLRPLLDEIDPHGSLTLQAMADELTLRGIRTPNGKAEWSPMQVKRLRAR